MRATDHPVVKIVGISYIEVKLCNTSVQRILYESDVDYWERQVDGSVKDP